MKKIVLITTTQPSVNPRIVKEADALTMAGHDVTLIYNFVADWAQELDSEILANAKWKYIQVGAVNKSVWKYKVSRLKFALYRFVNEKISVNAFPEKAHARCYSNLLKVAKKLKADWYIGHNPGAMAIAVNAAKFNKVKAGFDFEDYHRGEYTKSNDAALKRQIKLEKFYFNKFSYLTAASNLIANRIAEDFPTNPVRIVTILNCFSVNLQPNVDFDTENSNELKLFWFSQHIGKNRGLQILLESLVELDDPTISLTLVGNYTNEIKTDFENIMGESSAALHFIGVLPISKLTNYSATFDVGLAIEPGFSANNDIALSNKIFTYLLAGNAIIFSETSMQKNFNEEFRAGLSFPINDKHVLKKRILQFKNKEELLKQRIHNYKLAQDVLNWENESKKLIALIN